MRQINRREFMGSSLRGAAGIAAGAVLAGVSGRVLGANERLNLGLIGCGGRGRAVARGFIENGARFSYVCDLDEGRLGEKATTAVSASIGSMTTGFGKVPRSSRIHSHTWPVCPTAAIRSPSGLIATDRTGPSSALSASPCASETAWRIASSADG